MTQSSKRLTPQGLDALLLDWLSQAENAPDGHLTENRLNDLAVQDGWARASDTEREHLSRCVACTSAWWMGMKGNS